ncbi:MAG TPA: glycosyltransferase family 4 protein [Bryobacteraceae bacterium]|nr:glycosyltransferase family 4 protein [Bryobacteraceae bacterium]
MAAKAPASALMTADTVGGIWTYSMELVRGLAGRGTHVTLATMGQPLTAAQWEEARAIPRLEIAESSFRLEWMDEPWSDVDRASDWLLDLATRVCPDVVHINGYAHAGLRWNAPAVCVAHSCVLSWWRAVKREPAPVKYVEYARRVRSALAAADMAVAPSHSMLSCLVEEYGFTGTSVVVPNARSAEFFGPSIKQPFILASGRLWDAAKNIAAVDAVTERLSWPVYVAGDEHHPDGGDTKVGAARRLGRLSGAEMADWFGRASVYVLAARYEPFGLSALEAALCGCALVLGDIPSLREVWGDAALYVHPEDRDGLRETLERVIRSDSLRTDLAARARLRARRYTPQRMVMGYLEVYELARHKFESRARAAA